MAKGKALFHNFAIGVPAVITKYKTMGLARPMCVPHKFADSNIRLDPGPPVQNSLPGRENDASVAK